MERLQTAQNMALHLIGSYFWYIRTEKNHLDLEKPRLKTHIRNLALKLCMSAKLSRNSHIKRLGVKNQRVLRPFHILC